MSNHNTRLEQIRERWAGVTPGEWVYHESLSMVYARPEFDIHRFDQMDLDIFKVQESKQDGVAVAASKADVAYLLSVVAEQAAAIERVEKLAESWRYKGEFGWGAWQEGQGPDPEGYVLDGAAGELRTALTPAPNQEATL